MPCCSVFGCSNSNQKNSSVSPSERVRFFRFPTDKSLRDQWVQFCARKDPLNVQNARICSVHFTADDRNDVLRYRLMGYSPKKKLKHDAVPSKCGPKSRQLSDQKVQRNVDRKKRADTRVRRQLINRLLAEADGTEWKPSSNSLICSGHFESGVKSNHPARPAYNPTVFPEVHPKKSGGIFRKSCLAQTQSCVFDNCKNQNVAGNDVRDIKFFSFPNSPTLRQAWIRASLRTPGAYSAMVAKYKDPRICSDHFFPEDFELRSTGRVLKPYAVPIIFQVTYREEEEYEPKRKRRHRKILDPFFEFGLKHCSVVVPEEERQLADEQLEPLPDVEEIKEEPEYVVVVDDDDVDVAEIENSEPPLATSPVNPVQAVDTSKSGTGDPAPLLVVPINVRVDGSQVPVPPNSSVTSAVASTPSIVVSNAAGYRLIPVNSLSKPLPMKLTSVTSQPNQPPAEVAPLPPSLKRLKSKKLIIKEKKPVEVEQSNAASRPAGLSDHDSYALPASLASSEPSTKTAMVVSKPQDNKTAAVVSRPQDTKTSAVVSRPQDNRTFAVVSRPQDNKTLAVVSRPQDNKTVAVVSRPQDNKTLAVVSRPQDNKTFAVVSRPQDKTLAVVSRPLDNKTVAVVSKPLPAPPAAPPSSTVVTAPLRPPIPAAAVKSSPCQPAKQDQKYQNIKITNYRKDETDDDAFRERLAKVPLAQLMIFHVGVRAKVAAYSTQVKSLSQQIRRLEIRLAKTSEKLTAVLRNSKAGVQPTKKIDNLLVVETAPKCDCNRKRDVEPPREPPREDLEDIFCDAAQKEVPSAVESQEIVEENERLIKKLTGINKTLKGKDIIRVVVIQSEDLTGF